MVGKFNLDNSVTFTLDAMGDVIYVTDGQICCIYCRKLWDEGEDLMAFIVSKLEE
jgi:Holliday junction resolvase RusA-like endonuclease